MKKTISLKAKDRFKNEEEVWQRLPKGYGVVVYYDNSETVVYDDPKFVKTEGRYLAYNRAGANRFYGQERVTCMIK